MRLLVVEDDSTLAASLKSGLADAGFAVDLADTCGHAEELLHINHYDTVILDLGLPDRDGGELLAMIRRSEMPLPVLILTARGTVTDRIAGLDAGADDYLQKPFAFAELIARVRALLRRPNAAPAPVLQLGNLQFDRSRMEARVDGAPVHLTIKELALLEYFLVQKGQLVTRTMLLDHCWDDTYDGVSNLVDVHVGRLRRKLEQAGATCAIGTVRGAGFLLEEVPK
jgi:DNA-binding response OmpR family regulator